MEFVEEMDLHARKYQDRLLVQSKFSNAYSRRSCHLDVTLCRSDKSHILNNYRGFKLRNVVSQ